MENTQFEKFKEELKEKITELERRPKTEQYYSWSDDGQYLIHKTIITDIKPASYMDKVMLGKDKVKETKAVKEERIF